MSLLPHPAKPWIFRTMLLLAAFTLSACGGGGSSPDIELAAIKEEAKVKNAEIDQYATDTPCTDNSQCRYISKWSLDPCYFESTPSKVYSTASSTAAQVERAQADLRNLYEKSRTLVDTSQCPIYSPPPYLYLICVANRCEGTTTPPTGTN